MIRPQIADLGEMEGRNLVPLRLASMSGIKAQAKALAAIRLPVPLSICPKSATGRGAGRGMWASREWPSTIG
jgi:hypothetical protein